MKAVCWCGSRRMRVENIPEPRMARESGLLDKVPMGAAFAKAPTLRMRQTHVQSYMKTLLELIEKGSIDPSFLITHRFGLEEAPRYYDIFKHKQDECIKVVMRP